MHHQTLVEQEQQDENVGNSRPANSTGVPRAGAWPPCLPGALRPTPADTNLSLQPGAAAGQQLSSAVHPTAAWHTPHRCIEETHTVIGHSRQCDRGSQQRGGGETSGHALLCGNARILANARDDKHQTAATTAPTTTKTTTAATPTATKTTPPTNLRTVP
jgi:hypothetical protein